MNTPKLSTDANPMPDRLAGLSPMALQMLRQAERDLYAGNRQAAANALNAAAALAPRNAEVLRMQAVMLIHHNRGAEARSLLRELLQRHPDDPVLLKDLAEAEFACKDYDAALALLRRICELQPDSATAWFILGKNLKEQAWIEESLPALQRAVELAPDHVYARTLYADVLVLLGQLAEARAQYLDVLRRAPATGPAWWGLANIKTVRLSDDEIARLEVLHDDPGSAEADRLAMGCVLGKAYEDQRRYADAFRILTATNAKIRQRRPWNPETFSASVDLLLNHFSGPHQRSDDPRLGEEVIFIVSLPRSGSTLAEQILAAHPDVEGASELGDISRTLLDESKRRGVAFPHWIADATADDWSRLGRDYLSRTARWRQKRPISTDKMPNNWYLTGAILAMLPGAKIVNCRRDPVETCWSCFKQMFSVGNEFSYDLGYLAQLYVDYDRMMKHWRQREPERIRDQVYEKLLADPETQIRELLAFCRLPFNESVLRFHDVERSVRTASAAQVREPLQRNTARTANYGVLLDPLREALKPVLM
jgi:tetratricopeptide (TPR) repeat protein